MEFSNFSTTENSNIVANTINSQSYIGKNGTVTTDDNHGCRKAPFGMQTFNLFEITIRIFIVSGVSLCGIITNITNLIVFFRIGILTDSNTVSLAGLAISDFMTCVLGLWAGVFLFTDKFFNNPDSKIIVFDFYFYIGILQRLLFTQITCILTTYIAVERFVAIVFPFKVKFIFTAKNTLYAICVIYIVAIGIDFPQYASFIPQWVTENNRSVLKYVSTPVNTDAVIASVVHSMNFSLRVILFTTVITCNATMLRTLSNRKFRKSKPSSKSVIPNTYADDSRPAISAISTATDTTTSLNSKLSSAPETSSEVKANNDKIINNKIDKDQRLMAMMATICAVFIVCNTPDVIITIIFYVAELKCHDMYRDIPYMFSTLLENINSSVNIYIYYTMSSRYRQHFLSLWKKK